LRRPYGGVSAADRQFLEGGSVVIHCRFCGGSQTFRPFTNLLVSPCTTAKMLKPGEGGGRTADQAYRGMLPKTALLVHFRCESGGLSGERVVYVLSLFFN